MKIHIKEGNFKFDDFKSMDKFLESKGYKRVVGNCNEWRIGKMLDLGCYICGDIFDDDGNEIKVMNGTLIVNNARELANDVWQDRADFTESEWKAAVDNFASNLQDIYDWLCENEDCGFDMPDKLYILGDVINLLKSVDVRKTEEAV